MGKDCGMYFFLNSANFRSWDERALVVFQWESLRSKHELSRTSFRRIQRIRTRSNRSSWKQDKFGTPTLHSRRLKRSTISTAGNNYLSSFSPTGVDSAAANEICLTKSSNTDRISSMLS